MRIMMRKRLYSCHAKMANQPWLFWLKIWMMRYVKGTKWRTKKRQNAPKINRGQGRSIPSGIISMLGWTGSSFSSSLFFSSSSILSTGAISHWGNTGLNMDRRDEVSIEAWWHNVDHVTFILLLYISMFCDNIDHSHPIHQVKICTDYLTSGQIKV